MPRLPYSTFFGLFNGVHDETAIIAELPPGYTFVLRSIYGCAFGDDTEPNGSSGYYLTIDTTPVGSYTPVPGVSLADGYQYAWGGDSFPAVIVTYEEIIPIEMVAFGPMSWTYYASGFVLEGTPPWFGEPG